MSINEEIVFLLRGKFSKAKSYVTGNQQYTKTGYRRNGGVTEEEEEGTVEVEGWMGEVDGRGGRERWMGEGWRQGGCGERKNPYI